MVDDLREYVAGRAGRVRDVAERASAGPLLVRLAITVFAALSLALAYPSEIMYSIAAIPPAGVVALLPAIFPRTRLVGLAVFVCAFGWLVGTIVYGEPISVVRLVGLSSSLYLMHSLAALAAVLPYDAVLSPGVLAGWLLRAAGVVAVSALVSVVLLLVVKLTIGPVFLVASLVGVLAAGALAYVIVRRA
jgi:hypothetical protein